MFKNNVYFCDQKNTNEQMNILMNDNHELIHKIACLYYKKGITQQEIANRYGLSRIKVSRMLARAIDEKIVQIKIVEPVSPFTEMEQELEERFGLDEVVIADSTVPDDDEILESIGTIAAKYITEKLQGHETIGLTWGRTLYRMVNHLPSLSLPDLKIAQMLGGLGEPEAEFHGAELARRMAQAFSSRPRLIHSPAILNAASLCDELKKDIQVKTTIELAASADMAIFGIGVFGDQAPLVKSRNILRDADIRMLKEKKVVGDISLRFFDKNGEYVSTNLDDRIVGLTCNQIELIPRRIGLAGGSAKFETIAVAVRGKLIDVLITDHFTGRKLLEIL